MHTHDDVKNLFIAAYYILLLAASVFTKEDSDSGNVSLADWMCKGSMEERLYSIEITERLVIKQLERLRDDKEAGSDKLSLRFLSRIKGGISYPLTPLF